MPCDPEFSRGDQAAAQPRFRSVLMRSEREVFRKDIPKLIRGLTAAVWLAIASRAFAQDPSQFRFSFGTGRPAQGFTAIA